MSAAVGARSTGGGLGSNSLRGGRDPASDVPSPQAGLWRRSEGSLASRKRPPSRTGGPAVGAGERGPLRSQFEKSPDFAVILEENQVYVLRQARCPHQTCCRSYDRIHDSRVDERFGAVRGEGLCETSLKSRVLTRRGSRAANMLARILMQSQ